MHQVFEIGLLPPLSPSGSHPILEAHVSLSERSFGDTWGEHVVSSPMSSSQFQLEAGLTLDQLVHG